MPQLCNTPMLDLRKAELCTLERPFKAGSYMSRIVMALGTNISYSRKEIGANIEERLDASHARISPRLRVDHSSEHAETLNLYYKLSPYSQGSANCEAMSENLT